MKTPPIEFLLVCSKTSLQDFELNRLSQVANLRKQLRAIDEELRRASAEAELARWLAEYREDLLAAGRAQVVQHSFQFDRGENRGTGPAAAPGAIERRRPRKENVA